MTTLSASTRGSCALVLARTRLFKCWLLVLTLALCGCSCQRSPALATLRERAGIVERDYGDKPRAWQAADVGTEFRLGDGVQTLTDSRAALDLDDGARLALQESTLIRFSSAPPKERAVAFDVELGTAELSTELALSLGMASGLVALEPGTRVTLSRGDGALRFVVQVGQAVLGDVTLDVGDAVLIDAAGKARPVEPAPETQLAASRLAPSEPAPAPEAAPAGADVTAVVRGQGASIRKEGRRQPLRQGSTQLAPGTELELQHNTEVELERGNQGATLSQKGRYVVAPRPDVLVKAASGSLSAGSSERVRVEVPGGVIVVAPRGQVKVQIRAKGAARIAVESREAVLETPRGNETLSTGEQASLEADGRIRVEGRSLDYADLELQTGESVVIHDPSPPTAVRFVFGEACPETGILQLQGASQSFAVGTASVALPMRAGSYRYELRCESSRSKVVRHGRVSVLKDGGTRAMAVHPPSTVLQADGRNYTVLYQNRLPQITLTWPSPPEGGGIQLIHELAGKSETLELGGPSHTFPSGRLDEGKHLFHFIGGGKISRQTSLSILFDNAAPTASLNTPASVKARSGDTLTVSGTALPGWDVQIEGQSAKRDAQGRFSQATVMPAERRAVVIRISHPERGTHVYLRRRPS